MKIAKMALFDEPLPPYYQFLNRGTHVSLLRSGFSPGYSSEIKG
jgi:hypothetical protein